MINATRWGRLNPAQRQPLRSGKGRIETQVIPRSREDNRPPSRIPSPGLGRCLRARLCCGATIQRHLSRRTCLTDLGVAAVVCLGECDGSAAAGSEEQDLDVHHLGLDPRQPSMLQVMDRVLAVAREAPGAVAVCSGEGCWGGEWRGVVGTLAAAYLMRELGFDAGAADTWVRTACAEMSAGLPGPRSDQCRR